MMHGYGGAGVGGVGMFPFLGPLMGFGFLVVVGLVIWLVYSLVKHSGGTHDAAVADGAASAAPGPDPAVTIIRERYARGEIDAVTYEKLLADLTKAPAAE